MEVVLLKRELRLLHMVLRILVTLFWCINLFSCLFYSVGLHFYNPNYYEDEVTRVVTWLDIDGPFGIIGSDEVSMHLKYFYSFFFSMGTLTSTMGYGDIVKIYIYIINLFDLKKKIRLR
jgi:hypothetical protein